MAALIQSLPVETVPYQVEVKRYRKKRSVEANARYWSIVSAIAHGMAEQMDGEYHHPEVWHEWLATRFLGVVPGPFGDPVRKSTARLNTSDFSEYMEEVEAWAAEQGVLLEW